MRKALYTLTVVLLVGAVIAGCGKKENPFEPITDSYQTGAALSAGPKVSSATDMSGNNIFYQALADDQINIYFAHDLNNATVDTNSVILQNGANYARIARTVSYDVAARKIVIKAANGWVDSLRYLVTVTTNVTDRYGNKLDGNSNGWVDPQDNYRVKFRGFTATGWPGDINGPQITGFYPYNGTIYYGLSDSIRVFITDNDTIDTTSITAAQFSLVSDNGTAITLTPTLIITSWPASVEVRFKSLGLAQGTNYTLTVHTGIKDKRGNTLDGDNDGYSENETLDKRVIKFRTYEPTSSVYPPRVNRLLYSDGNRTFTIRFTKKMNPAYLTATYIKAYRNWDKTSYIVGQIAVSSDSMGVTYSLENAIGVTPYVWVSKEVRDEVGLKLNENGNNIGGEAASITNNWVSDDLWRDVPYTLGAWYILFEDKVESGNIGWTMSGLPSPTLWHRSTRKPDPVGGGTYNWYCGKDLDSTYNTGAAVHDTIKSPLIDLTGYSQASFYFDMWASTDGVADRINFSVSTDGGTTWTNIASAFGLYSPWAQYSLNINAYTNRVIRLAISLDTDAVGNTSEGAYFDNLGVGAW